jgi:hypothetical protein
VLPSEFFNAWLDALPKRGQTKLVAFLQCFLDDSGTHQNDSPICLVAGYIASDRHWKKISAAWEDVRAQFGAPVFHANRFFADEAFNHDYQGWTQEQRESYIVELVKVLRSPRLARINHGVDVKAFQSLTVDERRALTGGVLSESLSQWEWRGAPTKPYFLCFQLCLQQALEATEKHLTVHLICDNQPQCESNATEIVEIVKHNKLDEGRLGPVTFGSRTYFPPLQAADLLAHLWYIQASKKYTPFQDRVLQILMGGGADFPYLDLKAMRAILEGLPERRVAAR